MRRLVILLIVAAIVLIASVVLPAAASVGNGRFSQWREPYPVTVPTAGKWFPEGWRLAPGPGTAAASLYDQPATVGDGYGRVLYAKFDNYNPYPEPGRAWLTSHVFEYDSLIGRALLVSWWQRVDGCCVGVVPMLMLNYHNGDYEFWGAGGYFLASQDDVNWPDQTAKSPAEYKTRLLGAPYCLATTQWQQCAMTFQLPAGDGHVLSNKRHVSVNLNFRSPTAPGIHIAHMTLERL